MNQDHIVLGPEKDKSYNKVKRRSNLDVSDIDGARPRFI